MTPMIDLFHYFEANAVQASNIAGHICVIVSYYWLAISLYWFTTRSVLMKNSPLIYLWAWTLTLNATVRLGYVLPFPQHLQFALEFSASAVSITLAWYVWHKRHRIVDLMYRFKYVAGLVHILNPEDTK